jgi:hypothetical protein
VATVDDNINIGNAATIAMISWPAFLAIAIVPSPGPFVPDATEHIRTFVREQQEG